MVINRDRDDQKDSEYNNEVVTIRRASKTVKGGHTMRLSAFVVVGNDKGKAGVGLGEAGEVPEAIRKGKETTMKNVVTVTVDENKSIPYDFMGEYSSAVVLMKHAPEGTGIIASSPARAVVELAGIQNIRTKSLDSNNKTNVVLATLERLKAIRSPEEITKRHGKSVKDILN